ncbi:MAG: carbon starvation protein A [Fibrobacterota bacterium]
MSAGLILIISAGLFTAGYVFYGRFLLNVLGVDKNRKTPAHLLNDGLDFVPARAPVLMGHHFASIAGAAPIIGPVTAVVFGWGPVWLWIVLGGILIGGMHDFSALILSVRNSGKSVGEIIEKYVGLPGKLVFMIFTWATLILVVAVFDIVVARTFEAKPEVASASVFFIFVSVIFGYGLRKKYFGLFTGSGGGIVLLIISMAAGNFFPLRISSETWIYILLAYVFAASILPVWLLLQPRDYLNSFLLYATLIMGAAGIIFYNPELKSPAFTGLKAEGLGNIFPILFVTVACGAVSGFHSLVSSGTTSKQLNEKKDALPVGYGSMLIESLLAVIALITAAYLGKEEFAAKFASSGAVNPVAVFSSGIGEFATALYIPRESGIMFASLAISAFALTSLDTAGRLGRLVFSEMSVHAPGKAGKILSDRYFATLVTIAGGGILAVSGRWKSIWPLFGSANQLLASLALLALTVYMVRNRRPFLFAAIPMLFMFAVTLTSLFQLASRELISENGSLLLGTLAVILFCTAIFLTVYSAMQVLREKKREGNIFSGTDG